MEVPATEDFFDHRYYRINKMLLKLVGLWPYQTTRDRSVILILWVTLGICQMVAQAIAMLKGRDDWDFFIQCTVSLIFDGFVLTKFCTSLFNLQKTLELLNRMRTNWYLRARDRDTNIFHDYAENGRKMTIAYTVMMYTTWVLFTTEPTLPKVIDIVLGNGTEPGEFGAPVDYLVIDLQKYYFYIILHTTLSAFLAFTVTAACDSLFIVNIQHCCGLYAALGRVLERIGKNVHDDHVLATCIEDHNEAIKYSELIEASFLWCFFFIVGFNMLMISLTGFEIITRTTDPQQTVKFIVGNVVSMVHLFIECHMSQILMDHSLNIRSHILNSEWYKLPLKAQKVLIFVMMRCNMPAQLTAGKMYAMSTQSFGMFLKTSLSYLTLLHSV